jgi:folate-binding Fe-S cluster repair protein YgfZ
MTSPLQLRDRSDAGKLAVGGPDAAAFLQALLSTDLGGLAPGAGRSTALLTPKGRVRALARVLAVERGYLLHCERPALEGLFRGLWGGRIGWRAELHKLTLQQGLVTVVGDDAAGLLGLPLDAAAPEHAHVATDLAGIPVRAVRSWAGVDLVCRADKVAALLAAIEQRARESGALAEPAGHAAGAAARGAGAAARGPAAAARGTGAGGCDCDAPSWTALRIAAGRVAYGCDATEADLPAELALGPATVATEKGLYPGLQTVLRQQRSGTVHRRLCRVHAGRALLAPGDLLLPAGADPSAGDGVKPAGTITSAAAFDGLALVRANAATPLVHAETGTPVEVVPLEEARPSL